MPKKEYAPFSLYESGREYLKEQERKNEILAEIAGVSYEPPGDIPSGKYVIEKRMLDAAQKENELLEDIAEVGGSSGGANKLSIDYATDVMSLKKGNSAIANSGVTLPAYGLNYNSSTGGLTLTKNGTSVQGQTVSIPAEQALATAQEAIQTANNAVQSASTAAVAAMPDVVTSWLGEHISPADPPVVIDTSLSVTGAAADAKSAGSEIASTKSALEKTCKVEAKTYTLYVSSDKYYYFNITKFAESTSKKYLSTRYVNNTNSIIAFELRSNDFQYNVHYFDETGTASTSSATGYLGATGYRQGIQLLPKEAKKFVFTFHRLDDAVISSEDQTTIMSNLYAYYSVDETLTEANIAADAKTTGDWIGQRQSPITRMLFPIVKTGLNYSGSTDTNKRIVDINFNRVTVRPNHSNPTGSTYQTYLITGENPHFLANTISSAVGQLTSADFIDITQFSNTAPLYVSMSKITNASAIGQDATIYFVTRNSGSGNITYSTDFTLYNSGSGNTGLWKLSDYYLPEIYDNKNLAILLETRYANVNAEMTFSVFQSSQTLYSQYAVPTSSILEKPLPGYYKDEVDRAVAKINDDTRKARFGNTASTARGKPKNILFITDSHWADNKKSSPMIAREIIKRCNISWFVNGGDIIYNHYEPSGTKSGSDRAADSLFDYLNAFRDVGLPMLLCYGNHDANRDGADPKEPPLTLEKYEYKNIVFDSFLNNPTIKATFHSVSDTTQGHGNSEDDLIYWDDDKYRYAITYWYQASDRTVSWTSELFDTDKKVIVFNHGAYFDLKADMTQDTIHGQWLFNAMQNYSSQIRCFIAGHAHQDGLRWIYNGTVPYIVLDCDRFRDTKSVAGTYTENRVSVLTITDDSIKVTKIGKGLDFEVTADTAPFYVKYDSSKIPSIQECT